MILSDSGMGVSFINSLDGFALVNVGGSPTLFKTGDGGISWSFGISMVDLLSIPIAVFPGSGMGVSFINSLDGFALVNDPISPLPPLYKTTDGGLSWDSSGFGFIPTSVTSDSGMGVSFLLDDVVIPEPSTYLLMGAFLVVAMMMKRNRTKNILKPILHSRCIQEDFI